MSDTQAVEYRRLVSNLAASLSAEEVERVAYIRLTDYQTESPDKYNAKDPGATGLNLLATLERLRVFSRQNIDGLVEIAKDAGRRDLINKVKEYKKRSHAAKHVKKKPRKRCSEDQQHLEQTFEVMVTALAALEQHMFLLQRTMDGESDIQDESLELLRNAEKIAQDLAYKLHQAQQKLSTASLTSGSSSRSRGNDAASGGSTISVDTTQPPPPQKESVQQSATSTREGEQILVPLESEDKELYTYIQTRSLKERPMLPREDAAQLATASTGIFETNYQLHNGQVNQEIRGSGIGPDSETGSYSTVERWRQDIKNPSPDSSNNTYQSIVSENREPDTIYEAIERKQNVTSDTGER